MTDAPRHAWQDGAVRPIEACGVSLLDRGLLFSESIYEVVPIVDGMPRLLADHVDRMRAGAEALGIAAGVPDPALWERIAAALVDADGVREGVLYAQVTGGRGVRVHVPAVRPTPTFFAFVQAHALPRSEARVRIATLEDPRWARCDLKTTMLLPAILAKRDVAAGGADEVAFFSRDGGLAEGGSSSVFIVERGRMVSVPLSPAVLPGVTRKAIERLAPSLGIEVVHEPIERARMLAADEVAIASTTRLVMPVGHVDGIAVGRGPAAVTARIGAALRALYGLG